jgi:hypothetical protein
VQTLNRQFRLVTVATGAGTRRLVLEEAYDLRYCLGGGSSSEATITAWRPDSNSAAPPAFRITTRAISGAPARNLYRFESVGCCGSGTIGTYYSLLTGRPLFASSLRPLELGTVAGEPVRFIAFHDTFSAIAPVEATDSTVVGVFETADDSVPGQRVVLVADRAEPFALEQLTFWRNRRPIDDSAVPFPGRERGLSVAVSLQAPGSGRRVRVVVPIAGDSLDSAGATLPAGFSFRVSRGR